MYPRFERQFLESDEHFTVLGGGALGGKASGLAAARKMIQQTFAADDFPNVELGIPRLLVLQTDLFDQFVTQNNLPGVIGPDWPDDRIAHAFIRADMPALILGDLRSLIRRMDRPLAVRSSSLLEDALHHPFAGVYVTKMIPNNQSSIDARFKALIEAIKYVWASAYFRGARNYLRAIGRTIADEKMAVIIQEVVGERFGDRFYPVISGVARTHNFYPTGHAQPRDGVVNLALGLGKTIVDGGVTWSYSPRYPRHRPPVGSDRDLLANTQRQFWAVNMAAVAYDPVNEIEHLAHCSLDDAEWDDVLRFTASTYDPAGDRLRLGTALPGPRVLTFGPILELDEIPLNPIIERLLESCRDALESDVEIEFALTLDRQRGLPARFGLLQVRPMMVAQDCVEIDDADLNDARALLASDSVLGNGAFDTIQDVVYVRPDAFDAKHTAAIAREIESINVRLVDEERPYVLIGFGRWGSSDPWLGIPVEWPQVCGARVIVEATLPDMNVDASQGSHFFHNMISFRVLYFTVRHDGAYAPDWDWLERQPAESETQFIRYLRLAAPLHVRVDGRTGRGVVLHG